MKLLILFIVLNVLNVVIQTIKSIATIKCGKVVASLVNAVAYGLYTVVIVYMVCDIPLWEKVLVVAAANLVGVYVVKLIEEKSRKDKLWKIDIAVFNNDVDYLIEQLEKNLISYSLIKIENSAYHKVEAFAPTQEDTQKVKDIISDIKNIKYFISETKSF